MKRISSKLLERLERQPSHFEPTTAYHIAHQLHNTREICSAQSTYLHPSSISGFSQDQDQCRLQTNFAPLTGPTGCLPPNFNEALRKQARQRSFGLSAFIDIFNTRIAELFVAASDKYRLARMMRWATEREQPFIEVLLNLIGCGTGGVDALTCVERGLLLRYVGFFAQRVRNAECLTAMLRDASGLPIKIQQIQPKRIPVPFEEQTRLGRAHTQLDRTAMIGASVISHSNRFVVQIGPLDYKQYESVDPFDLKLHQLFDLTRFYVGDGYEFDFQLILRRDQVPVARLFRDALRPGWNVWLGTESRHSDNSDCLIRYSILRSDTPTPRTDSTPLKA